MASTRDTKQLMISLRWVAWEWPDRGLVLAVDQHQLPLPPGNAVRRRSRDDSPGVVERDVGDGDLAVLRDQPVLFGPVGSTATARRVLDKVDPVMLNRLRAACSLAREQPWAQRSETTGPIDGRHGGGRTWPGLRIMLDATLVAAHSDKELAAATSADGAGATRAWLAHLRSRRSTGVNLEFSVGFTMTATVQSAILALPKRAWTQAINADGSLSDGADVAELTGMLGGLLAAAGWCSAHFHRP
jgi:hypothetical protein